MIKPDNINFLSTLPAYIGIGQPTGNIVISGTILNGSGQSFSITVPTSPDNTRFDVYGVNQNTNIKQLLSNTNFPLIYQYKSTEFLAQEIDYAPSSITVIFQIQNFTGSSVTLINQTIAITIVEYQIPY